MLSHVAFLKKIVITMWRNFIFASCIILIGIVCTTSISRTNWSCSSLLFPFKRTFKICIQAKMLPCCMKPLQVLLDLPYFSFILNLHECGYYMSEHTI